MPRCAGICGSDLRVARVVAGRILLIPGSLRAASTNMAVLRTVLAVLPNGVDGVLYDGLGRLPHFNPDDDREPLPGEVASMRAAIHGADAVVFSTPEYAGALPGSFKNLLDWTIGDDQPGSIYEKPVGWVNASPHRNARGAHAELRTVLNYAHATIVEDACVEMPVGRALVGGDGRIVDAQVRATLTRAMAALAAHAGTDSIVDPDGAGRRVRRAPAPLLGPPVS